MWVGRVPDFEHRRTPRNVLREIADAFEVSGNTHGPEDLAQISGDWLATRDRQNRPILDLALQRVEARIALEDGLRQSAIAVRQGVHRVAHHLTGDVAHLRDAPSEFSQFPVKRYDGMIAHHPLRITDPANGTSPRGIFHLTTSATVLPAGNSKSRFRFWRRDSA